MKIIIASGNKGKIADVCRFFPNAQVISQNELQGFTNPEETGKTFEENSLIKANALYDFIGKDMEASDIILADDSGILVSTLGKEELGVYTKRQMVAWCKKNNKTEINFWNHIVDKAGVGAEANFVATITVIDSNGKQLLFKQILSGKLTYSRGNNGFGFDPIFEVNGKTFAEYTNEEKQQMSPRAKALEQVQKQFTK